MHRPVRNAPLMPTKRRRGAPTPLAGRARLPVGRLMSAVAVGVVVVGAAACSSGGTAPTTGARRAAAQTTRFVSKRYGYSIVLPGRSSDWTASYALVGWTTAAFHPGSPGFDTFTSLKDARRYVIAARRPPTGPTLAKWTSFVSSLLCTRPASVSSTLSGAPARTLTWSCSDLNSIAAVAVHGRRGYFLVVASPKTTSGASNRSAFAAARKSFGFLGG